MKDRSGPATVTGDQRSGASSGSAIAFQGGGEKAPRRRGTRKPGDDSLGEYLRGKELPGCMRRLNPPFTIPRSDNALPVPCGRTRRLKQQSGALCAWKNPPRGGAVRRPKGGALRRLSLCCPGSRAPLVPGRCHVAGSRRHRHPVDASIAEAPSSVTVIGPTQIEQSDAANLGQLLNGQPDVVVNDYGTQGGVQTVSIRGSTSDQVLVLLDGVRLNAADGSVDLSSIPLEAIDHIEIVRGVDSSLYGSGAIGGVINIITRTPEKPSASVSVTNGSFLPHAASTVASSSLVHVGAGESLGPRGQPGRHDIARGEARTVGTVGGGRFSARPTGSRGTTPRDRRLAEEDQRGHAVRERLPGAERAVLGGELAAKAIYDTSDTGAARVP